MPRNVAGNPIDPTEWNRNDGFSPGQLDRHEGARARHAGGVRRRPARCRSPTSSAPTTATADRRASTRDTRQAAPDLVRARRQPGRPGGRQPDHPPGRELRRGRPLHRRAAEPARTRPARRSRRSSRSASTATACTATTPAVEARRPHMEEHLHDARPRRASRATTSTWPGTSRSRASATSPSGRCTSATTRSPQLGDTDLADLQVAGQRAAVRGHRRDRLHAVRQRRLPERRGRPDRARGRRHLHRAVLPERARLPARLAVRLPARARRLPQRIPGNTQAANFICLIPRVAVDGAAGRPGAAVALRPRPARQRQRGHRRQRQGDGERAQLRLLRHRLDRHVDAGHAERRRRSSATCRTSRRSPTARSRGSSTSCTSGRLMIHPSGFGSDPAFQFTKGGGRSRDRHHAACSTTATARAASWAAR